MHKKFIEIDLLGASGGMDQYVIPLLNAMAKFSSSVCLITNNKVSEIPLNSSIEYRDYFGRYLRGGWCVNLISYICGLAKTLFYLYRQKEKINCVVHCHFFSFGFLDFFRLLMLLPLNVMVVSTIHDVSSLKKKRWNDLFRGFILNKSDSLVVHNEFSKKILSSFCLDEEKIKVIKHGNYVEFVRLYSGGEKQLSAGTLYNKNFKIGFVGQIKKVKNLEFVLDSLKGFEGQVTLTVKGKISDYRKADLELLLENSGIECEYEFGYLSNSEMVNLLESLDVVVLPYKEIYQSGVLLLSMSAGAVVLCSDLEPFKDVVVDGVNGFIYKENCSDSFVSKLQAIKSMSSHKVADIRRFAFLKVKEEYSWEKIAEEYKLQFL